MPERPPVREGASWMSPAPAFDVRTSRKMPAPCRRQAARNGSIESRPRNGLTVSASASGGAPARLEEGGGVRACGGADVAALAVGDHEQADLARVGAHRLERAPAVGAERLEEGDLRLDCDDVGSDRLGDTRQNRSTAPAAAAAPRAPRPGARRAAGRRGVEPDHELGALALDCLGDTIGERGGAAASARGHAANGTPSTAEAIAGASSATTLSSGGGRRRNAATASSSASSGGARQTRARPPRRRRSLDGTARPRGSSRSQARRSGPCARRSPSSARARRRTHAACATARAR